MYTGKHAMSDDSIDVVVDSVESNQYRSPKNPKFKLKAQIWKKPKLRIHLIHPNYETSKNPEH